MNRYWGIDAEGKAEGIKLSKSDVHSIQICPSTSEDEGIVFWKPSEFKQWLTQRRKHQNRPDRFYAFTLAFEYGSLSAWELLNIETKTKGQPWQFWADNPINLFYIRLGKMKIPVIDTRRFFYQLRYGNDYLTNLKAVADYLSDYYKEDIHKLEPPLGEDFGKRPPTSQEKPYFAKYGIRDAYISAKAGEWIEKNIVQKWLKGKVPIEKLYSWGTVAREYFDLPTINEIKYYGKRKIVIKFPNLWHKHIYEQTFAGRSEAFQTGVLPPQYYNDVSSLYPYSIIRTQCLLIKNVKRWKGNTDPLLGKITWQRFYETTGYPYGWIVGDFKTEDDIWGLPQKVGTNNLYLRGTFKNKLYHTLDLEAGNATIQHINTILIPTFDPTQKKIMKTFEEFTSVKLEGEYKSQIEKYCIKNTVNSLSGYLGKSHPFFSKQTNIPAYSTLLAQSHLVMSRLFHSYQPTVYTDTDSFFWRKPVNKVIEHSQPYPTLAYQTLDSVPLEVGCRGKPEGNTIIFRGKMYYQNPQSMAFSGWKPFPQFFKQIIKEKPTETTVHRQKNRKWKTRDKDVTVLAVGRWIIIKEKWNLKKLKRIFRADRKRHRPTYDSYQLFLEGKAATSKAWNTQEINSLYEKRPWKQQYTYIIEDGDTSTLTIPLKEAIS